jgi:hypothetical protein
MNISSNGLVINLSNRTTFSIKNWVRDFHHFFKKREKLMHVRIRHNENGEKSLQIKMSFYTNQAIYSLVHNRTETARPPKSMYD